MPVTHEPWGTITKPPFELGYQKLSIDEIDTVVERLYKSRPQQSAGTKRPIPAIEKRQLNKQDIQVMVDRLANKETTVPKTPDRHRTHPFKKEWGVCLNSYAWNGKNHQAILCGEESPWTAAQAEWFVYKSCIKLSPWHLHRRAVWNEYFMPSLEVCSHTVLSPPFSVWIIEIPYAFIRTICANNPPKSSTDSKTRSIDAKLTTVTHSEVRF